MSNPIVKTVCHFLVNSKTIGNDLTRLKNCDELTELIYRLYVDKVDIDGFAQITPLYAIGEQDGGTYQYLRGGYENEFDGKDFSYLKNKATFELVKTFLSLLYATTDHIIVPKNLNNYTNFKTEAAIHKSLQCVIKFTPSVIKNMYQELFEEYKDTKSMNPVDLVMFKKNKLLRIKIIQFFETLCESYWTNGTIFSSSVQPLHLQYSTFNFVPENDFAQNVQISSNLKREPYYLIGSEIIFTMR